MKFLKKPTLFIIFLCSISSFTSCTPESISTEDTLYKQDVHATSGGETPDTDKDGNGSDDTGK